MKKKIAILLTIVLVLSLSVVGITSQEDAYAKSAQMYLEIPDSIKKENEFTVKVVLDSDVQLYSVDAYLSYNAELLEFVPDNEYVTGANGLLELKDVYEEETKKAEYEITFKALDLGTVEIALTDVYLIDYADLDYISVASSAKSFNIGVNKTVANDARLSDLIVAPGEMTTTFDPDELDYEMHVGLDVDTVGVSAIPLDDGSVVDLEMPDKLAKGENVIKITVTALSGNVNVYTIRVIKEEITTEEKTEEITEEETTEVSSTEMEDTETTTEISTEATSEQPATQEESTTEPIEEPTESETTETVTESTDTSEQVVE